MGMTLYDIDAQIAALDGAAEDDMLIDEETGELVSVAQALDALADAGVSAEIAGDLRGWLAQELD